MIRVFRMERELYILESGELHPGFGLDTPKGGSDYGGVQLNWSYTSMMTAHGRDLDSFKGIELPFFKFRIPSAVNF